MKKPTLQPVGSTNSELNLGPTGEDPAVNPTLKLRLLMLCEAVPVSAFFAKKKGGIPPCFTWTVTETRWNPSNNSHNIWKKGWTFCVFFFFFFGIGKLWVEAFGMGKLTPRTWESSPMTHRNDSITMAGLRSWQILRILAKKKGESDLMVLGPSGSGFIGCFLEGLSVESCETKQLSQHQRKAWLFFCQWFFPCLRFCGFFKQKKFIFAWYLPSTGMNTSVSRKVCACTVPVWTSKWYYII